MPPKRRAKSGVYRTAKLLITMGVDFGDTFSGQVSCNQGSSAAHKPRIQFISSKDGVNTKEITVIKKWPCSDHLMERIQTRVMYDDDGMVAKWGGRILSKEDFIQYFKLLLNEKEPMPQGITREDLLRALDNFGKTPEDAATNFFLSKTTIEWVIEVPAMWTDAAKDATGRAAVNVGMINNLRLVTEPEAAAVYTLAEARLIKPQVGSIICCLDCGEAALDAVTPRKGALEGGAFLDERFVNLLKRRLGSARFQELCEMREGRVFQAAMDRFQLNVKTHFDAFADELDAKNF
ncbi:Heat shock protein 12B [Sphaceloma murrayae]|uniref:Heat shock protein 12B n=1 Tax=Sphaceloma murrayae TaxID=2082308 RepID=A0A2K1QX00_9PEZI|nr:Heat shock protein 12B [Sphaceloma murrayae]